MPFWGRGSEGHGYCALARPLPCLASTGCLEPAGSTSPMWLDISNMPETLVDGTASSRSPVPIDFRRQDRKAVVDIGERGFGPPTVPNLVRLLVCRPPQNHETAGAALDEDQE